MNPKHKQQIQTEPLPENAADEAKLAKWEELSAQYGLSGEWATAARLGEPPASEEQIEMIGHLFGR